MANGGNSPLGPWFVVPPVVGGTDTDTVVHATTAAQAQHDQSLGYAGYSTQAQAEAAAGAVNQNQQQLQQLSNSGISIPGLSQVGDFFHRLTESATWIRVAKVITGSMLLIVGLVHITGVENAAASVARKVPLPV